MAAPDLKTYFERFALQESVDSGADAIAHSAHRALVAADGDVFLVVAEQILVTDETQVVVGRLVLLAALAQVEAQQVVQRAGGSGRRITVAPAAEGRKSAALGRRFGLALRGTGPGRRQPHVDQVVLDGVQGGAALLGAAFQPDLIQQTGRNGLALGRFERRAARRRQRRRLGGGVVIGQRIGADVRLQIRPVAVLVPAAGSSGSTSGQRRRRLPLLIRRQSAVHVRVAVPRPSATAAAEIVELGTGLTLGLVGRQREDARPVGRRR